MYGKLLQFLYIYIESMHQIKGSLSLVGQEAHATLLSQTPATAAIYIYIYMRCKFVTIWLRKGQGLDHGMANIFLLLACIYPRVIIITSWLVKYIDPTILWTFLFTSMQVILGFFSERRNMWWTVGIPWYPYQLVRKKMISLSIIFFHLL
jgi:hypothetical protein